jgi:hypothetical protein
MLLRILLIQFSVPIFLSQLWGAHAASVVELYMAELIWILHFANFRSVQLFPEH